MEEARYRNGLRWCICPLRVQAVSKRSLFKQFNLAIGFEAQNLVLSFSLSLVGWGARMCRYI